ncbi:uncharacterized protein JN550_013831 [Neoarthrinium moseri]|uniref:uncharacterized protein n=1 Tax=Neoarthrinium moseri TaxID=1658444 RepID=UPI001FDE54A1|nr:uncharacterized protein JN550_013831 [Neoarthrinium moseri]KAI1856345.1 hypothetical protein JN550_013831 [Neoarthrinium moseri]
MPGFKSNILLAALAGVALAGGHGGHGSKPSKRGCTTPTANLRNGTYIGVTDSVNDQEYFLGMPYAQAPTGSLRFAAPQPLQTSFSEPRSATQYGKACIGYGSDTTNLGTGQGAVLLNEGKFARVPLLLGNNFDEGTAYAKTGINTTEQFQSYLSSLGLGADQVASITELYPDDLSVGIPASYPDRPAAYPYGLQYKRVAAFAGHYQQHAGRRHLAESYAGAGLCVYSYLWNVYVNGIAAIYGATHFQEVAFVFDNTDGLGYATNPFEGKPETFKTLADLMSKMWVSFMHGADPNLGASETVQSVAWPRYTLDAPDNLVFDVNATGLSYVAEDNYRKENIAYLLDSVFV